MIESVIFLNILIYSLYTKFYLNQTILAFRAKRENLNVIIELRMH